jgi:hypothetical protein
VGLTYSVDQDGSFAQTRPGHVLLPNLTQIFPMGTQDSGSIESQQYTANRFATHSYSSAVLLYNIILTKSVVLETWL